MKGCINGRVKKGRDGCPLTVLTLTGTNVQCPCRALLEKELESVGIRLNKSKPNIYFKVRFPGLLQAQMCLAAYSKLRSLCAAPCVGLTEGGLWILHCS